MARAGATMDRRPIDPRNDTFCISTRTAFLLPAMMFIFMSTAAAPSISRRPSRTTLVMPPASSSVEKAMSFLPLDSFVSLETYVKSDDTEAMLQQHYRALLAKRSKLQLLSQSR